MKKGTQWVPFFIVRTANTSEGHIHSSFGVVLSAERTAWCVKMSFHYSHRASHSMFSLNSRAGKAGYTVVSIRSALAGRCPCVNARIALRHDSSIAPMVRIRHAKIPGLILRASTPRIRLVSRICSPGDAVLLVANTDRV